MKLDILFENEGLVVFSKPAGLLVVPDRFDPTLPYMRRLAEAQLQSGLFVVHRLDRDTSGVICFAKNEAEHKHLSEQFQSRAVDKFYLGLVHGRMLEPRGTIEAPIGEHPDLKGKMTVSRGGKAAHTDYTVEKQWPLHSLLRLQIHTGRTHQIRVHCQSIGHSIVCDELYGDGKPFYLSSIKKFYKQSHHGEPERPLLARLGLHAQQIDFTDSRGEAISVSAPLPKDMAATVRQLDRIFPDYSAQTNQL